MRRFSPTDNLFTRVFASLFPYGRHIHESFCVASPYGRHIHESFCVAFCKKRPGLLGQRPKSPPQRRNLLGVFGSFCARGVKKNGNDFLTFHPNNRSFFTLSSFSPFFFDGAAAKEEHICFANENGVFKCFAPAGATRGSAPRPREPLKRLERNFSSCNTLTEGYNYERTRTLRLTRL